MTFEEICEGIKKLEARREELFNLKEPIDEELVSSYETIAQLKNQRDSILGERRKDDVEWLLDNTDGSSTKLKLRDAKLEELGLFCFNTWKETSQASIYIALIKNDEESYKKTLSAVKTVLPYVKPHKDGSKRFCIMDHTPSSRDFHLSVNEKEVVILKNNFDQQSYPDLESALRHVQKSLWYKKASQCPSR